MIVMRRRKRREAAAREAESPPSSAGERPKRPLAGTAVELPDRADMDSLLRLVLRCGQVVHQVIKRAEPDRSSTTCPNSHEADALSALYDACMAREQTNGTGSVAVLGKAMALLDRIAEEGEATPARLAELTGEPRSTVYRLLASLQQLELVEPGPRRGTFVLGLKLFRLGRSVVSRFDERQAALPVMERIHDEMGENTFLCVRRGYNAVCIERIDGTRVTLLALSLGGSLPLHAGGASRALLAFEPESFWEEYLDRGM